MKFLLSKDIRDNFFLRNMLIIYVLGLLFIIPLGVIHFVHQFGWSPEEIYNRLHGVENLFIEPMDVESLVLFSHTFLFFKSFSVITIFSLLVRTPLNAKLKLFPLYGSFISSIFLILTLFLTKWLGTIVGSLVLIFFGLGETFIFLSALYVLCYLFGLVDLKKEKEE